MYVTDGHIYQDNAKVLNKIDQLIEGEKIQPISVVFIDPRDIFDSNINYRQDYYLCNSNYVNFIVKELLPETEKYYPIANDREQRGILGHSFGGLFSAYIGLKATNSFKNIAMQSPAFHPCPDIYSSYKQNSKLDLKIYLSYGTGDDTENQDTPMVEILNNKSYKLKINRVKDGNHDWNNWENQIEDIMLYFYENDF